jgi:hypothetical protein
MIDVASCNLGIDEVLKRCIGKIPNTQFTRPLVGKFSVLKNKEQRIKKTFSSIDASFDQTV